MIDLILSESDFEELSERYKNSSNEEFLAYFAAFVNKRRIELRASLMRACPSSQLLAFLSKEYNPTKGQLKHIAKAKGWRKDVDFISAMNRKKASRKYEQQVTDKALPVSNITAWLRSVEIGQTRIGKFDDTKKCKSVSSILTRWNHTEGLDNNIFISARYFWDKGVIVIRGRRRA